MKRTVLSAGVLALVIAGAGPVGADEPASTIAAQGPIKVPSVAVVGDSAFGGTQRLKVVCPQGESFLLRVQATQLSGARSIAGASVITCTGRTQHVTVSLSLGPGGARLPLDLTSTADRLAALVSLSGGPGAQDSGRTRLVLAAV